MRIATLDLIRYGRFDGMALSFPRSTPDMHLVVGPNEAGKTTARAAVSDLLFGFAHNSPYSFRFESPQLRIGATLEGGERILEMRRRKGRAQTLLDASEKPLPDSALGAFVGDVNQAFFERMFSLDHRGLIEGGRALLDSSDDLGRMLFQSAAGIAGFGVALDQIEAEVDALWSPRRSEKRAYYAAETRYRTAEQALKDGVLRAKDFQDAIKGLEAAQKVNADVVAREVKARADHRRLSRLAATLPKLARLRQLLDDLDAYRTSPQLPADAATTLMQCEQEIANADQTIARHNGEIARLNDALEKLRIDDGLLHRAEDIEALSSLRQQTAKHAQDIVKQQTRVDQILRNVVTLSKEIGWGNLSEPEIRRRLPNRLVRANLQRLARRFDGLATRADQARRALTQHHDKIRESRAVLATLPPDPPSRALVEAIDFAHAVGDAVTAHTRLTRDARAAKSALDESLEALKPWSGTIEALRTLVPPKGPILDRLERRLDDAAADIKAAVKRRREFEDKLRQLELRASQIRRDESPVPQQAIIEARADRDHRWVELRRHLTEGSVTQALEAASPYKSSVAVADQRADQRFEHHEASVTLTKTLQDIEAVRVDIDAADGAIVAATQLREAAERELLTIFARIGLPVLSITEIRSWIKDRDAALKQARATEDQERSLGDFTDRIVSAAQGLERALGRDPASHEAASPVTLAAVVKAAARALEEQTGTWKERTILVRNIEAAAQEERTLVDTQSTADASLQAWQAEWKTALASAAMPADLPPAQVDTALNLMADVDKLLGEAHETRETRIDTMRRDLRNFESTTASILEVLAPELAVLPAAEAVRTLKERLDQMRANAAAAKTSNETLEIEAERAQEAAQNRQNAHARIVPLLEQSEAKDFVGLREAIVSSDARRALEAEVAGVRRALLEAGGGSSLPEIEQEAAGRDPDAIRTELDAAETMLTDLGNERQAAGSAITTAQARLEGMQGREAAIVIAEERQSALSDMSTAVERWAKLTVGARLLREAIDLYRDRKQAPLLLRAGQLFSVLTLGEFENLSIDYGRADHPTLVAVRRSGEVVTVDGLSTGTVDQLYLALRISAVEGYLETGAPMPFVADDLFINYDDERAMAGLRVLADLATKTQVLFFTHHVHLARLAAALPCAPISMTTISRV